MGCIVAELALVFVLSMAINKLPVGVAYLMFLGYAALNGLTLSVVFIAYELALVQKVFFITAGMFGGLALWGTFTKGDLSSVGSVCGMALWGLIIAGILIFTGLTMYDAQKVMQMAAAEGAVDSAAIRRVEYRRSRFFFICCHRWRKVDMINFRR